MRYSILTLIFFCTTSYASAHTPVLVTETSLHDIVTIENPELSRAFYGEMNGFPHTFEIQADTPFHFFVQVLLPDIESSKNNVSGIIIKEVENNGRVKEVARLLAKDAKWESFYELFGGDSYRMGGIFEADVEPGVYRIEVSTPDNTEKYVLVVGKIEGSSDIGYFETIRRIAAVKVFFEKPKIFVLQSPLVYVPLLILGAIGFVFWGIRKKLKIK